MSQKDAAQLPLIASLALFSFFLAFKYLHFDPSWILGLYFAFISWLSLISSFEHFLVETLGLTSLASTSKKLPIHPFKFLQDHIPRSVTVTPATGVGMLLSGAIVAAYWVTRHWFLNNFIACSLIFKLFLLCPSAPSKTQ